MTHLKKQDVANNTKASASHITKIKGTKNIEEFFCYQRAKEHNSVVTLVPAENGAPDLTANLLLLAL